MSKIDFGGAPAFGGRANTEFKSGFGAGQTQNPNPGFGFGQAAAPASVFGAAPFGAHTATFGAPAFAAASTGATTNDEAFMRLESMMEKLVEKVEAQKAEIVKEAHDIREQAEKHYMDTKRENDKLKTENAELTTRLTGVDELKSQNAELVSKLEQELEKLKAENAELLRKFDQQREKFNVDNAALVHKFEQVLREHRPGSDDTQRS